MPRLLRSERVRGWLWQFLLLATLGVFVWWLVGNVVRNLEVRHIATGFSYLTRAAPIPIAESPIDFVPSQSSYGLALLIGMLNTLKAATIGIVFASAIGAMVGVARLTRNRIARGCATTYVEILRGTPLLLQLLMWYGAMRALPGARQAWTIGSAFISNRGLVLPMPQWDQHLLAAAMLVAVVTLSAIRFSRYLLLLLLIFPIIALLLPDVLPNIDRPYLRGFNFVGGVTLTPEFLALVVGLVIYTSAYIAEIVRSGLQAVPKGQWEAASALGIGWLPTVRRIIFPQAMRVILPPLVGEYLNLTKNTTLAVAIGYQDVMSIGETTLNQTGQSIETITLIMAFFLSISLITSACVGSIERVLARRWAR